MKKTVSLLYASVIKKICAAKPRKIFFAPSIPKPFLRPCHALESHPYYSNPDRKRFEYSGVNTAINATFGPWSEEKLLINVPVLHAALPQIGLF